MGETTGIAWCHHTFNPWWGCVEVSPACDYCYARTEAIRFGHRVWGKDTARRFFGDQHWNEPVRWNRKAELAGERRRVFCASMADVGEERDDEVGRELGAARARLVALIAATPSLDWLLLTKRPTAFRRVFPPSLFTRSNVWPGVTVEHADYMWRLDELIKLESAGQRWVSYEPVLGRVDFARWLGAQPSAGSSGRALAWIIVGAENRAATAGRFADQYASVARDVIAQGRAHGVAIFHKQMPLGRRISKDPREWPADLRVQDVPR